MSSSHILDSNSIQLFPVSDLFLLLLLIFYQIISLEINQQFSSPQLGANNNTQKAQNKAEYVEQDLLKKINYFFYIIYIILDRKPNKMNENKKKGSAQQTLQMIECGNLDLNFSIKYGTLLLGKTKRGKTTSAHYIMHQPLKGGHNDQNSVVYLLDNGQAKFSTAKIGQKQSQSETQIPNFFDYQENNEKKYLIDCPGYLDSFGCFRIISNRFFHMQVLSKVQNVRFIVTFCWNDMQWTADSMFEAFRQFLSGFSNLDNIQNELINATCILITSVPEEKDLNGVRQKYKLTSLNIGSQYEQFYQKLKKQLVEKKRVFMFKKAKLGQYCDVNNTLFNEINESCTYWERKVNPNGEVEMGNIKISLVDYLERDTINFNKELNQLKDFYSKHYESDIKNFISVISQLVDDNKYNSQAQQDSCKFIEQMKNISSQKQKWRKSQESNCSFLYQKYQDKRNKLKDTIFKPANILTESQNTSDIPFWLLKIKSLQKIEQISEKIAKSQAKEREIENLSEFAAIIKNILEILITLAKSKKTKDDSLKNKQVLDFAYEIFKVIEISNKIYRLVSSTTNSSSSSKDCVKNLGGSMYFILVEYPSALRGMFLKAIKKNSSQIFIENMNKIDTQNLTSKGSAEVSHFLSQFQISLQKKKPDSIKLDQSVLIGLSHNIDTKIAKLNANALASIKKQPNLSLELIFKIEEERKKIEKKIHQSNQNATQNEKLKGEHNRVVHVMAECLYKNSKLQLALQVYETLFDADKIFQILDLKEQKLTQDKSTSENLLLDHYVDYMNRARKYHRKQLAIKKAQKAYHVAQEIANLEKISQISNFIRDVSTNKPIEDDVYMDTLLKQIVEAKIPKELCQKITNTARLVSPMKKQK